MKNSKHTNVAVSVLQAEADAVRSLVDDFDEVAFKAAADLILNAKGYCLVSGMGKSGHIGAKLAATLASTGTPSFFLHPTEAIHGDLGMMAAGSVLLALSNSGESAEMKPILMYCKANDISIIAVTAQADSSLGRAASVLLRLSDVAEACPNGLAPTTSTAMSLALGDALAISVMAARSFLPADFGARHPGGKLGKQLQNVREWMDSYQTVCPVLAGNACAKDVIGSITKARTGCVGVVDKTGSLVGIITDGDLRRALEGDIFAKNASQLMTKDPITVSPSTQMGQVVGLMKDKRIGNIFVVEHKKPIAVIDLKDLVEMGYM